MYNPYILRHEDDAWDDHKYVARVPLKDKTKKNKWRYFYDMAAYKAYQAKQKVTEEKPVEKKETTPTNKVADTVNKLLDSDKKATNLGWGASDTVKDFVTNVLNNGAGLTVADMVYDFLVTKREEKSRKSMDEDKQEHFEDAEKFKDTEPPKSFDDLDRLPEDVPNDEDRAVINPYYDTDTRYDNDEYTTNCSYCTAAYDMRQRGYDVQAAAIDQATDDPTTVEELISWYDGAVNQDLTTVFENQEECYEKAVEQGYISHDLAAEAFEKDMLEHGDGARGFLCLYWSQGGGHAVAWEVENGEVVIRDCQTNETVELEDYVELCDDLCYFRTDNVEPNEEILKVVRNRSWEEDEDERKRSVQARNR